MMDIKLKGKIYFITQWAGILSYLLALLWRLGIGPIEFSIGYNIETYLAGVSVLIMGVSFFSLMLLFIAEVKYNIFYFVLFTPWPRVQMVVLLISLLIFLYFETKSFIAFLNYSNKKTR